MNILTRRKVRIESLRELRTRKRILARRGNTWKIKLKNGVKLS